jgi:hypothetical protein
MKDEGKGAKDISLSEYLRKLEEGAEERDDQVRDGIELYVGLWKKAVEAGAVSMEDRLDSALEKVERKGGLYEAAGEKAPSA